MRVDLMPLTHAALIDADERALAVHSGQTVSRRDFCGEVALLAVLLERQTESCYALHDEAAYPFAVSLFAALHAGKKVWIPGNNRPATAERLMRQGCRLLGDWDGMAESEDKADGMEASPFPLHPLDPHARQLILYTSGSGGEPKAIEKSLFQLQNEVEALERQWGALLGSSTAVATVSHQHIYGLLFRLLWPLAAGRPFHSPMYLSPEPMLNAVAEKDAYWVASPAQLKRLDELTPWGGVSGLKAVFSSGGPLPTEAAERIQRSSGRDVIEIYGSSETGGIGWRRAPDDGGWTLFPGICLQRGADGRCRLMSPYLSGQEDYPLDDRIDLKEDGRFMLEGRLDRIVKVEEKRLSLDQMERVLKQSNWVEQAHCQVLPGARERVAALIVPTEFGREMLRRQGRAAVIRGLRLQLLQAFEAVVLPRKWLFFDTVPLTAQGKIDSGLLTGLCRLPTVKFPQLLYCRQEEKRVVLELRVRPGLVYFDGHFPGQPILPGVAQLAWVESFARLFFALERPFRTMEVLKFKRIIQPGALLTLALEWKAEASKLYFEINSDNASHSSGRLIYGDHA